MEIDKFPIDRTFRFVAGIIPGLMAILVYCIAHPAAYYLIAGAAGIGYKTKISLVLALAFVIGNSLTVFATATLGAIGGIIGVSSTVKWPRVPETAPWRDPKWRKLAARYLGEHAPDDTQPLPDSQFNMKQTVIRGLPEVQQARALLDLAQRRMKLASDDSDWRQWYLQLDQHRRAVTLPA